MTKDKAVEHLRGLGYDAYLDDGVVMVRMNDLKEANTRKVHKELKAIGYDSSYGYNYTANQNGDSK